MKLPFFSLFSFFLILNLVKVQAESPANYPVNVCPTYQAYSPTGSGITRNVTNQSQLESALNAAQPGDVINLATGTYQKVIYRLSLGHANGTTANPIVIQAGNGQSPVINGGGYNLNGDPYSDYNGVYVARRNNIIVRGLEVTFIGFGIVFQNVNGGKIEHNIVHNTGDAALAVQAYWNDDNLNSSFVEIKCNEIYDTGNYSPEFAEGIYIGSGGSTKTDRTHDILIRGNNIYNINNEPIDVKKFTYNITIEDNLIHDSTPWYGGAICLGLNKENWQNGNYLVQRNWIWNITSGRDYAQAIAIGHGQTTVRNNVIWNVETRSISWPFRHVIQVHNDDSASPSAYGFGNPNARQVDIYNNTIWDCSQDCINNYLDPNVIIPNVISRNNLLSSLSGGVANSSTDLQANTAHFVGPLTGNADAGPGEGSGFNLQASTTAVDGATTYGAFNDDILSTSRPQGNGWDFGAYERGLSCPIVGTPCDDNDPTTFPDLEDGNCNCVGTPISNTNNTICKTLAPPILDGQNDDWQTDTTYQLSNFLEGGIVSPGDLKAEFQVTYDDNYLYIFGKITDEVLLNDSPSAWQDDGLELYLDGGNEKSSTYDANDHQLVFGVNETYIYYPSGPADNPVGVEMMQVVTADGYQMEISVAWSFIGVNLSDGQSLGIDIHVNDDDTSGGRDAKLSWNATVDNSWLDASTFGTMELSDDCPGATIGIPSTFRTGVTFTQYSLDNWGDPTAIQNGKTLLDNSTAIVNQHVMGFGAGNPEISPDVYDFSSIANRIGKTNGAGKDAETIVLTACCAPDWMKGGIPGQTDWTPEFFVKAPFPSHYADYAQLVKEIVQQPEFENIKYIQVWNEMKGMWNDSLNRWDYEGYTDLYNHVWDSVKMVRPDIQIGGPYVSLSTYGGPNYFASDIGGDWGKFDKRDLDVISYWLVNKRGADFLTIDGWNINFRDNITLVNQFEHTKMFADFAAWFRTLDTLSADAAALPIWWAEWYAMPSNPNATQAEKNALMATGLIHTIKSGAATALIWGPQGATNGEFYPLGLFSDTQVPGGGVATPFHQTQKDLHDYFSNGTPLIDLNGSNSSVELIASCSKMLLVNKTIAQQFTQIEDQIFTLSPYEVRLVNTPGTPCAKRAVTVDLQIYLEGPYNLATGTMDNTIQQFGLLPEGQPYSVSPWNYLGTEGAGWINSDYPAGTVDWVLLSFRTTTQAESEVSKVAALLLQDGSLYAPVELLLDVGVNSLYVVVEHRNHLPVMSTQPVTILNNSISYNFKLTEGYLGPSGFGQKLQSNNVWMLFSANGDQFNPAGYEITGADKILWQSSNGNFSIYQIEDFNLDGDVNGADKLLWDLNNGISSGIPR